jgi:starch phosphorylase
MLELLDRYFGPRFYEEPANLDMWDRLDRISDEELWRTHERRRERLVVFARDRLKRAMKRSGAAEGALHRAEDVLSPYAITISFARRFATYKRGNLLLRDPERLLRCYRIRTGPFRSSSRARPIRTTSPARRSSGSSCISPARRKCRAA